MRSSIHTLSLVSVIVLMLCLFLFAPVEAARDEPRAYSATVSIRGLPESVSTTVYMDGSVWGRYRGGATLKFLFMEGTTHTVSVDRIVNDTSGVSYVCESNIATFLIPGPEYPFNYTPVEPIPEFGSYIPLVAGFALILAVCSVYKGKNYILSA